MPYYRQEKLFRQSHVPVNRTTMANLMNTCADRCVALWLLLKEELLGQSSIHGDETTIQVLKEPQREAQTKSFMWLYCSAARATRQVILFDYQETRTGSHPRDFLAEFAGYLQTDGYSGYEAVENVTQNYRPVHCYSWSALKQLLPWNVRLRPQEASPALAA